MFSYLFILSKIKTFPFITSDIFLFLSFIHCWNWLEHSGPLISNKLIYLFLSVYKYCWKSGPLLWILINTFSSYLYILLKIITVPLNSNKSAFFSGNDHLTSRVWGVFLLKKIILIPKDEKQYSGQADDKSKILWMLFSPYLIMFIKF